MIFPSYIPNMKGANRTTHILVKITEIIRSEAMVKGISISGCIMRILKKYDEDKKQYDANDANDVILARKEI
jgi:hypothetical protein